MAINTYTRYRDYSQFQSDNPDTDLNGADLDTDFDRIKTFADAASAAIADVRRDDGQLKNASVGLDQIKSELVPFLNKAVTFKGDWATATVYAVNDFVSESSSNYVCLVAHTSGTFATDLAAGKWHLISTTGSTGGTGAGYTATSTTSIAIGTGSKVFTTQSGLAYSVGARVRVSSEGTPTAYMEGLVSVYSGTSLTVEVAVTSGSGTKADWNINLAGEPGSSTVPGYLDGLAISKDTSTPNSVLDIAAGSCADSTGTTTITLAAITKSTASSWSSGNAEGGMGVGLTVAASTWYHVFAIISGGVADVYFDTDEDATNKPSSTTAFRKIGSFKTDSSSHITTPFIQAVDVPVIRGYLAGLGTTNDATTPNSKINVAEGLCADSTNTVMMTFVAGDLNCSGTGANGLDTGSLAASQWYFLFVIGKTDGSTALLASTSSSAPTMPSGYTYKRRIASFVTDSSSHITTYIQDGDSFSFIDMQLNANVNSAGTSDTLRNVSTPTGLRVKAKLLVGISNSSTSQSEAVWVSDPSVTAKAPSLSAPIVDVFPQNATVAANVGAAGAIIEVFTNTSGQVRTRQLLGSSTTNLSIYTLGYIDTRGRNA